MEGATIEERRSSKVRKGDVVRTGHGESHSLGNVGDKDLELMAIILFE
jgi:mannose-6-phosphate isomerase-like protein (cupin superfamily)